MNIFYFIFLLLDHLPEYSVLKFQQIVLTVLQCFIANFAQIFLAFFAVVLILMPVLIAIFILENIMQGIYRLITMGLLQVNFTALFTEAFAAVKTVKNFLFAQ